MQALFQSYHHSQARAKTKFGVLLKLVSKFDVTVLQETHGHAGDLDRLRAELPHHWIQASFHRRSGAGGVVMIVHKSKLHGMPAHHVVEDGRVHYADMAIAGCSLRLINVHVDPAKSEPDKQGLLRTLATLSSSCPFGAVVLGDFNFQAVGDDRFHPGDASFSKASHGLAPFFEKCCGHLA